MSNDPYAPPSSDIAVAADNKTALYSPVQAAIGAAIGGPVGLIYFLYANFEALGNERLRKNTMVYGAIMMVALLIIIPLLPERFPKTPISIAYIVAARYFAEHYQITKQGIIDSTQYTFHSNWRVVGYGLLCMVGTGVIFIGAIYALSMM